QTVRATQLDALLPGLGHQLLGHALLIESRLHRLPPYCFGCHVIDRVSHGLTPFVFQTSQFHHSADSPLEGLPIDQLIDVVMLTTTHPWAATELGDRTFD